MLAAGHLPAREWQASALVFEMHRVRGHHGGTGRDQRVAATIPAPARHCRTVSFSAAARPLLLRVQADLLALLAGERPRGAWARSLKRDQTLAILRDFSFVMLGPLGEGQLRAAPGWNRTPIEGPPPDDWHPGVLPPEIAAPAVLACATFLAHESGTEPRGVRWDRRTLSDGQGTRIDAETLLWHLTFREGETLREMFARPLVRPFSALLAALQADRKGAAAQHEARRRQWKMRRRSQKTGASAAARTSRAAAGLPSPRYALTRFVAVAPVRSEPKQRSARAEAATAVYMAFGTDPAGRSRPCTLRRHAVRQQVHPLLAAAASAPATRAPDRHSRSCGGNRQRARCWRRAAGDGAARWCL